MSIRNPERVFLCAIVLIAGGCLETRGGTGGAATTSLTGTQQDQALAVIQAPLIATDVAPLLEGGVGLKLEGGPKFQTVSCSTSGNVSAEVKQCDDGTTGASFIFQDCSTTQGPLTATFAGTADVCQSASTTVIHFGGNVTVNSLTLYLGGTLTVSLGTTTYDVSGSYDLEDGTLEYQITGALTASLQGDTPFESTVDGTLTITLNSDEDAEAEVTGTCTFDDFIPVSATTADWDTACGFE